MTTSSAFGFFPPSIQSSACSTRRCASSPVNFNRLGSLCLFDLRISPSMVNTVELSTLLRSASSTSPSRILETMVMVVARPPPPPLPPDPPDLLLSPPSNSSPQVKLHHFPELLSSSLASRALHRSLSDLLALTRLPSAVKLHLRRLSPEPPIDLNGTRSGWFLVTIRRTTTPPRSSHTIRTLPRPAGLPRSPSAVPGTVSSGKDPPSQSVVNIASSFWIRLMLGLYYLMGLIQAHLFIKGNGLSLSLDSCVVIVSLSKLSMLRPNWEMVLHYTSLVLKFSGFSNPAVYPRWKRYLPSYNISLRSVISSLSWRVVDLPCHMPGLSKSQPKVTNMRISGFAARTLETHPRTILDPLSIFCDDDLSILYFIVSPLCCSSFEGCLIPFLCTLLDY